MKLHLPKGLLALALACICGAATSAMAADGIISVNFYNGDDDKIVAGDEESTENLNGATLSDWYNFQGNVTTPTTLYATPDDNTSAEVGTLLVTGGRGKWESDNGHSSLIECLREGYLDLTASGQYTISLNTDYMVSDVYLYLAGDNSGKFSPVSVNGESYIGGKDTKAGDTTEWGTRDTASSVWADNGTDVNAQNTILVTNVVGPIEVQNVSQNDAYKRATLAGFQVIDKTAENLWVATGDATTGYTYSKGDTTGQTLEQVTAEGNTYLGFADGQSVDLSETTLSGLQASSGSVTVNGTNINTGILHAKDGSTLDVQGTLSSSDLTVSGLGTVQFTRNQTVKNLNLAGTLELAANTMLSVTGSVTSATGSLQSSATSASNASILSLASGVNSTVSIASGYVKLAGAGSQTATSHAELGRLSILTETSDDAEAWTGNVIITATNLTAYNLNQVGNAGSTITLQGAKGYFSQANSTAQTYTANLVLKNSADGTLAAYESNNGWGGDDRTFSGSVSGNGNWVRGSVGSTQTIRFTGDVSEWEGGHFRHIGNADKHITHLYFSGDAQEINIDLTTATAGFNIHIENDKAVVLNSDITDTADAAATTVTYNNSATTRVTSTSSSYKGNTTISAGTVALASSKALGNSAATTVADGATLEVESDVEGINLGADTHVITIDNGATLKTDHGVELTGALTMSDGATLDITGMTMTYAGSATVLTTTGTLSVGNIKLVGLTDGVAATVSADDSSALTVETLDTLTVTDVVDYDADANVLTLSTNLDITNLQGDVVFLLGGEVPTAPQLGEKVFAAMNGDWDKTVSLSFQNENGELIYLGGVTSLSLNNYSGDSTLWKVSDTGFAVEGYHATQLPEPTTTTLSLLALAGLAARRRRK